MIKKPDLCDCISDVVEQLHVTMAQRRKSSSAHIQQSSVSCLEFSRPYQKIKTAPFTDAELVKLKSLVLWASYTSKIKEETVESLLANYFEQQHIEDIDQSKYVEAVIYLLDFCSTVN